MKISQREGDFRCRPPRSLKGWFTFICIFTVLGLANAGISCEFNATQQCVNSNCSVHRCVECLVCPPGHGLYPQCGTALKVNESQKCLPCNNGTYSAKRDFGSCHSCDLCVGQETLQTCNGIQNAICKEGCQDGYQLNEYYMCQKIPTTPGKQATTSTYKPTAGPKAITWTKNITGNNNDSEPTMKPPSPPHKHNWINTMKKLWYVVVGSVILITLAIGIRKREKITRFMCNLYCSCRGHSPRDQDPVETPDHEGQELEEIVVPLLDEPSVEGVPSSDQSTSRAQDPQIQLPEEVIPGPSDVQMVEQDANPSPRGQGLEKATAALPDDILDLYGQPLKNLPYGLKHDISVKISSRPDSTLKGWKDIGSLLNVAEDKLEGIENASYWERQFPGKLLLQNLESSSPHLTVKDFVEALESCGRKDVICCIHESRRK